MFLSLGSHLIDWLPVRTCRSLPEAGLRTAEDSARSMDSIKHTVVKNQDDPGRLFRVCDAHGKVSNRVSTCARKPV